MDKVTKSRISGKVASYVALAAAQYPPVKIGAPDNSEQSSEATQTPQYPPVKIGAPDNSEQSSEATQTTPNLPAPVDGSGGDGQRRAPPRVRKPSPNNNQYLAPTPDLEHFHNWRR